MICRFGLKQRAANMRPVCNTFDMRNIYICKVSISDMGSNFRTRCLLIVTFESSSQIL